MVFSRSAKKARIKRRLKSGKVLKWIATEYSPSEGMKNNQQCGDAGNERGRRQGREVN